MTEANYSNNDYYHYAYDAVGNRELQTTLIGGQPATTNYHYNRANHLKFVNSVEYMWDDNGNLLNDGVNTYDYDSANRLVSLSNATTTVTYQYNGLGDRLKETVSGTPVTTTTFTMDLNPSTSLRAGSGLTQALSDGTNTYIYGNGRIAQAAGTGTEYFLGDALGSVRQLTNNSSAITYARAYDPYGVVTTASGSSQSVYGYTGEHTSSNLVHLRARMYAPGMGRFLTRDTWMGDYYRPLSLNRWIYTEANSVNFTDPSGNLTRGQIKQLLGHVETWEEVLAMFEEGGQYGGLYGLLELLRQAEVGDTIYGVRGRSHSADREEIELGKVKEIAGVIWIWGRDHDELYTTYEPVSISSFAHYPAYGREQENGEKTVYGNGHYYSHLEFNEDNGDAIAIGLVGACGSFLGLGWLDEAPELASLSDLVGGATDVYGATSSLSADGGPDWAGFMLSMACTRHTWTDCVYLWSTQSRCVYR